MLRLSNINPSTNRSGPLNLSSFFKLTENDVLFSPPQPTCKYLFRYSFIDFIFVSSLILTRIQISVSQRPDEEYSDLMLDMVRDIFYILLLYYIYIREVISLIL